MYTYEEVLKESLEYFKGDELAATTWIKKYCLRDLDGNLLEKTPEDMHRRIAKEILRIEDNYPVKHFDEETLMEYLRGFKYIVPGGSSMSGIGDKYKHTSLSNCFFIGNNSDSYGGIMLLDEELIQLSKRRGGVGIDLSHLRPSGAIVTNDARSSSGAASFMNRYSNSSQEVAQNGRRGALMLSIDITHPDSEAFIDAKLEQGKISGANISVKVTDEFMTRVKDNQLFIQRFPCDVDIYKYFDVGASPSDDWYTVKGEKIEIGKLHDCGDGVYMRVILARDLWNKIIHNAWAMAEPGVLFWNTILHESPADLYDDFKTGGTNPCGEIPLCPYDSCRLLSINLYGVVNNPFTEDASIDYDKLKEVAKASQIIMDDIMDLEIEHIEDIMKKIKSDPEDSVTKEHEIKLWEKIYYKTKRGRRTGIGVTGIGDMLAALSVQYGSETGNDIMEMVMKTVAIACYEQSIQLAKERGAFPTCSIKTEFGLLNDFVILKNGSFINRMLQSVSEQSLKDWKDYGRRNIACLTCAPSGTISIMTQTTSGIEPLFMTSYTRRRKVEDKSKATYVDVNGIGFEEFRVVHPKFVEWYSKTRGYTLDKATEILNKMNDEQFKAVEENSPWKNATAQTIDPVTKVKLQGRIQKWIDHSISCTVNLPKETTEETVRKLYELAYKVGCKGLTVYRDGCREGVLVSNKKENKKNTDFSNVKRPRELPAKVYRFKNQNENWIAFIGFREGRPYEIFTGKVDNEIKWLPKPIKDGVIVQVDTSEGRHRYDFLYEVEGGYTNAFPGISNQFEREYWNYARFVSGMLRAGIPLPQIVSVLKGLSAEPLINVWKEGVARALSQFIEDGTKTGSKCPNCGADLIFEGGCSHCPNGDYDRCG